MRPTGQPVNMRPDEFFGGIVIQPGGSFPLLKFEVPLFDLTLSFAGSTAVTSFDCENQDSLRRALEVIANHLPAFISQALRCPVEVLSVGGTVGSTPFSLGVQGSFTKLIKASSPPQSLAATFASLRDMDDEAYLRLASALKYMLQARRLDYAQSYPSQFLGERLLNMYKAIEVLFGRQANLVRSALTELGLSADFCEAIVSLVYIRDEVDVGHPAIHSLGAAEYEDVYAYSEVIEDLVSWLLDELLRRAQQKLPILGPPNPSGRRSRTLAQVASVTKKLDLNRRDTFFARKPTGS